MQAPAAAFIESAKDGLSTLPEFIRTSQRKELASAIGEPSDDLIAGYELGLQTARIILSGSPLLQMKGINPKDLL